MTSVRTSTHGYTPTADERIGKRDAEAYQQRPLPKKLDWVEPKEIGVLGYSPLLEKFLKGEPSDIELGFLASFSYLNMPGISEPTYIIDILDECAGDTKSVDPRQLIFNTDTFIANYTLGLGHTHPTGGKTTLGGQDKHVLLGFFKYRPHILFAHNPQGELVADMLLPNKGTFQLGPEKIHLLGRVNEKREVKGLIPFSASDLLASLLA